MSDLLQFVLLGTAGSLAGALLIDWVVNSRCGYCFFAGRAHCHIHQKREQERK